MSKQKLANQSRRIRSALEAVLPPNVSLESQSREGLCAVFKLAGRVIRARWVAAGWPAQVKDALVGERLRPNIVVAPQMSPGAREILGREGIGWIDELGAAEFILGSIVVSRSGREKPPAPRSARWSPAVLATAEALLCGTSATVSAISAVSGLSSGACTNALRSLTNANLLIADSLRGRNSARRVKNADDFLEAYATAAAASRRAREPLLEAGGAWRDVLEGLINTGKTWDKTAIAWAATGAAAAEKIAPTMTTLGSAVVYVDGKTISDLEAIARRGGLQPIVGGRLTLKPFPTISAKLLATNIDGLMVAPWPRVYADLRIVGVRGEDAAEHLKEVIRSR